jgi:hypothetical protein
MDAYFLGPRLHGGDQAPAQGLGVPEQQSRYEFFGRRLP